MWCNCKQGVVAQSSVDVTHPEPKWHRKQGLKQLSIHSPQKIQEYCCYSKYSCNPNPGISKTEECHGFPVRRCSLESVFCSMTLGCIFTLQQDWHFASPNPQATVVFQMHRFFLYLQGLKSGFLPHPLLNMEAANWPFCSTHEFLAFLYVCQHSMSLQARG